MVRRTTGPAKPAKGKAAPGLRSGPGAVRSAGKSAGRGAEPASKTEAIRRPEDWLGADAQIRRLIAKGKFG